MLAFTGFLFESGCATPAALCFFFVKSGFSFKCSEEEKSECVVEIANSDNPVNCHPNP